MKSFNEILKKYCDEKNNRLCIGLDVDNRKLENTSLLFMKNHIKKIIDATIDICPVYKINLAFYECLGPEGMNILLEICKYINTRSLIIGDAKRGDIGNSSKYYAEAIFEIYGFDAITISPYMGIDSMEPFIHYKDRGIFILCLTSNDGSKDLQYKVLNNGQTIYSHIAKLSLDINYNNNIGLVVGATKYDKMMELKKISKSLPWLIPGVGFQKGNLKESMEIGSLYDSTSIINVSRGIIQAGDCSIKDIRLAAKNYTNQIRDLI